jgi:hypothetical protein
MILVVITNGTFVIDSSSYDSPITLMLDGKVITRQCINRYLTALLDSFNTFTTSDGVSLTDEQHQSDEAYINLASDGQMFADYA